MKYSGFICFINADLTDQIKGYLMSQLFLTEIISSHVYEQRNALNPLYPSITRGSNKRILVIQSDPQNANLLDTCDCVIFAKEGIATITNKDFSNPKQIEIVSLKISDLAPAP